MNNQKFYEAHFDKALKLVEQQIADYWTKEEIASYWYHLGYDIFFFNKLKQQFKSFFEV